MPAVTLRKRRLPAKIEALRAICEIAGQRLVFEQAWLDALKEEAAA